jgi:hypothetical protein
MNTIEFKNNDINKMMIDMTHNNIKSTRKKTCEGGRMEAVLKQHMACTRMTATRGRRGRGEV